MFFLILDVQSKPVSSWPSATPPKRSRRRTSISRSLPFLPRIFLKRLHLSYLLKNLSFTNRTRDSEESLAGETRFVGFQG
jgi:hypothetical protein